MSECWSFIQLRIYCWQRRSQIVGAPGRLIIWHRSNFFSLGQCRKILPWAHAQVADTFQSSFLCGEPMYTSTIFAATPVTSSRPLYVRTRGNCPVIPPPKLALTHCIVFLKWHEQHLLLWLYGHFHSCLYKRNLTTKLLLFDVWTEWRIDCISIIIVHSVCSIGVFRT